MGDYSSLLFFTTFSQAAVGIMLLQAFRANFNARNLYAALALGILGALASLGHLGDPWICFFTIANVGSSWLSREIVMCVIFCASIIACLVYQRKWMDWLSAALGILFIYVMARVYMLPTEPDWDSVATFFYFLCASLMLGGSLLLLLDAGNGEMKNPLLSSDPIILMCVMVLSVIFAFMQMPEAGSPGRDGAMWYITLLVAGAGLVLPLVARHTAKLSSLDIAPDKAWELLGIGAVVALVWMAEFCGRASFYKSFTWFGM